VEQYRVFSNPLVKRVAFEIRFPNLFYLADRVGDFQVRVMKDFPESKLLYRRQLLLVSGVDKASVAQDTDDASNQDAIPIWQFTSRQGVQLSVSSDALSLVSDTHNAYSAGDQRFRDVIESTCAHFFASTKIPILKRIGLRYVDEGPIPEDKSDSFSAWYQTAFSLRRFPLERTSEMSYMAVVARDRYNLRYIEALKGTAPNRKVVLDFDAWAENVEPTEMLPVVDELHTVIWKEFMDSIKQPLVDHMSQPKEHVDATEG
jgi:uncharacterized protein (TIGR04255 family)